jgi:uncharacterized OsmC-like protein
MEATVYLTQKPLRARYGATPEQATVTDHARTCGPSASDPFHTRVEPMDGCGVVIPIGTHAALGGPHDAPTPGDMLCAALAACQDSALRMVANLLGITLTHLEVRVTATVDVRGTLAMDPAVPVGFQTIDCEVLFSAQEGTPVALLEKLQITAKRCCVVQQTLKAPPHVKTTFSEPVEQPGLAGTQAQAAQSSA